MWGVVRLGLHFVSWTSATSISRRRSWSASSLIFVVERPSAFHCNVRREFFISPSVVCVADSRMAPPEDIW